MKVAAAIFGVPVQVNKSTMKVSRGQWQRLKGLIGRTSNALASTNELQLAALLSHRSVNGSL